MIIMMIMMLLMNMMDMRGIVIQDQVQDEIADNSDGDGVDNDDEIHNYEDHHDDDAPHDDREDNEDIRAHDGENYDGYGDGDT